MYFSISYGVIFFVIHSMLPSQDSNGRILVWLYVQREIKVRKETHDYDHAIWSLTLRNPVARRVNPCKSSAIILWEFDALITFKFFGIFYPSHVTSLTELQLQALCYDLFRPIPLVLLMYCKL